MPETTTTGNGPRLIEIVPRERQNDRAAERQSAGRKPTADSREPHSPLLRGIAWGAGLSAPWWLAVLLWGWPVVGWTAAGLALLFFFAATIQPVAFPSE